MTGILIVGIFRRELGDSHKKLNGNINTRFYESHASVSSDGKRLYFTSNRDGGYGGLDIYMSELDSSGEWGPAVNLGIP
jgi:Tol biopolymer transport system component